MEYDGYDVSIIYEDDIYFMVVDYDLSYGDSNSVYRIEMRYEQVNDSSIAYSRTSTSDLYLFF